MQQRRPKNFGTQSIDSLKLSKAFSKADAGFVCYATSLFGEASDVVVYTLTAHFWHLDTSTNLSLQKLCLIERRGIWAGRQEPGGGSNRTSRLTKGFHALRPLTGLNPLRVYLELQDLLISSGPRCRQRGANIGTAERFDFQFTLGKM
jgi:hypothetical protein